jgi:hypothetical protein
VADRADGDEATGADGASGGSWTSRWRAARPQPRRPGDDALPPVTYIRCGGCGQVTPHTKISRSGRFDLDDGSITDVVVTPPEVVCDICDHGQPRSVDDVVEPDALVECCGTREHWSRTGPAGPPCGATFAAPTVAEQVLCPRCQTMQPPTFLL